MRIACAINPATLMDAVFDVAVLSECVDKWELEKLSMAHPAAFVVGAVVDEQRCCGQLLRGGVKHIDYTKVLTSKGLIPGDPTQRPVKHFENLSIAVVVCRDIDLAEFCNPILDELNQRQDAPRILCIPADMAEYWFRDDPITGAARFSGVWVALSNSTASYPSPALRCASFIADPMGNKMVKQSFDEPIFFDMGPK